MAITNVRTVQRVEVYPPRDTSADATTNAAHETLMVVYTHTFDDSEDSDLPVTTSKSVNLSKFVEDGGDATSVSGEDALVQTICTAIWG